jgi:hypothetical protein
VGPLVGHIELWSKWKAASLTQASLDAGSHGTVRTEKRRWLRKFDTTRQSPAEVPLDAGGNPLGGRELPIRGCNVELTRVTLPGVGVWWTFGFEAFGALRTVEEDLRKVAVTSAGRLPEGVTTGLLASYPAWLRQHAVVARA